MKNPDQISKAVYYRLSDIFEISAIYDHGKSLMFRARPYIDRDEAVGQMKRRLRKMGFSASVREDMHGLLISVQAGRVIRLLPPLIINDAEAEEIVDRVVKLINALAGQRAA